MTDLGARRRDFEIGRVMTRIFGVLGANAGKLALLALLIYGVPQVGMGFLQYQLFGEGMGLAQSGEIGAGFTALIWFGLASFVVAMVFQILLQAATIHLAVEDLKGRGAGFADALGVALRNLFPLIGLSVLQTLGLLLGFLLLVVPGVILSLAWAVTVPALVIERSGVMGAFDRSADLTRNHRGAIFMIAVIFVIAVTILSAVATGISAMLLRSFVDPAQVLVWSTLLVDPLVNLVTAVVGAVGVAAIYFELRWVKSGPDAGEELAAIFD